MELWKNKQKRDTNKNEPSFKAVKKVKYIVKLFIAVSISCSFIFPWTKSQRAPLYGQRVSASMPSNPIRASTHARPMANNNPLLLRCTCMSCELRTVESG